MNEFPKLRQEAGYSIVQAVEKLGYCERTIYRWETGESAPRKAALETLRAITKIKPPAQGAFRFIDLFAGIGGMRKGFEAIGGKCVFTSERDRLCAETYLANHKCDHDVAGDITTAPVGDIPEHDMLLAGFPRQPFSIAGVAKKSSLGRPHGFRCDAQGTLSARYYKDGSETLVSQGPRENPRRLTPRECARLTGFDGRDGKSVKIPVSDTQAHKQFGNAVVVPVVEAVARHMQPFITGTATVHQTAKPTKAKAAAEEEKVVA
ncbi:DNA cytosine methyltransferase [Spiribacter sp. 221]|uniref:DNA cytosine methyltransferase n=1 Tax=Spiribacter onubensis TaxID=3122420 RepID=UPI00349F6A52